MAAIPVNTDNYVRAESARMFDGVLATAGGTNVWMHSRVATPVDEQIVIRMNRDTLYSAAIVDISNGATLIMPEAAGRYMTAMIVNEDHYINRVISQPGTYRLTVDEFDTDAPPFPIQQCESEPSRPKRRGVTYWYAGDRQSGEHGQLGARRIRR